MGLIALCASLADGFIIMKVPAIKAMFSGIEADKPVWPWIGKRRDLLYLHTYSGAIDLYEFKLELSILINRFLVLPYSF